MSLAWPAAVFGSVWLFRKQLIEMLPNFRAKYKDVEIDFRLREAEKQIAELPKTPSAPAPTPEEDRRFRDLAELSPKGAILEVRAGVEEALRKYAVEVGELPAQQMPLVIVARALRAKELFTERLASLFDDLRVIGNQAAHDPNVELKADDAVLYKALADSFVQQLAELTVQASKR